MVVINGKEYAVRKGQLVEPTPFERFKNALGKLQSRETYSLAEEMTIPEGESLDIPWGATLLLTENGKLIMSKYSDIYVYGTLSTPDMESIKNVTDGSDNEIVLFSEGVWKTGVASIKNVTKESDGSSVAIFKMDDAYSVQTEGKVELNGFTDEDLASMTFYLSGYFIVGEKQYAAQGGKPVEPNAFTEFSRTLSKAKDEDTVYLNEELVIPKNSELYIPMGVTLEVSDGGKITLLQESGTDEGFKLEEYSGQFYHYEDFTPQLFVNDVEYILDEAGKFVEKQ